MLRREETALGSILRCPPLQAYEYSLMPDLAAASPALVVIWTYSSTLHLYSPAQSPQLPASNQYRANLPDL